MAYVHPESEWSNLDPPPTVATTEEIAIAAELWRAVERKYLGNGSPAVDGALPPGAHEGADGVD